MQLIDPMTPAQDNDTDPIMVVSTCTACNLRAWVGLGRRDLIRIHDRRKRLKKRLETKNLPEPLRDKITARIEALDKLEADVGKFS